MKPWLPMAQLLDGRSWLARVKHRLIKPTLNIEYAKSAQALASTSSATGEVHALILLEKYATICGYTTQIINRSFLDEVELTCMNQHCCSRVRFEIDDVMAEATADGAHLLNFIPTCICKTWEYGAILDHYQLRTAARSQVRLMDHIDQGIKIMRSRHVSTIAQRAFCLHPLLQGAAERADYYATVKAGADPQAFDLAIEYCRVANAALSTRNLTSVAQIELSDISDVNEMLIADKVQNRRDFQRHHEGTHERSAALTNYFNLWMQRLTITPQRYAQLIKLL